MIVISVAYKKLKSNTRNLLHDRQYKFNAVDLALEAIIELYNKTIEDRDDVLLVTLIRIANKYRDQFVVWKQFLDEDTTMVAEITKRFSRQVQED